MAINKWVTAARLRTLPLSLSGIILGNFLAASQGFFNPLILILSLLTTLLFQVLSNYANDYGDGVKGTDDNRVGEKRAVASGLISALEMKKAVWITAVLAFISGTTLSVMATKSLPFYVTLIFTLLGLAAILSAIKYTVGKKAYGYSGFGDFFVLIFFGLVSVAGSYFLQSKELDYTIFLPAFSIGFLAMGVLNLNNMRDLENDKLHGKKTIAVRLGLKKAKIYHGILLLLSFDFLFLYNRLLPNSLWQNLYFLTIPLLVAHLLRVSKATKSAGFEPLLKHLSLITLLVSFLFGVGKIL